MTFAGIAKSLRANQIGQITPQARAKRELVYLIPINEDIEDFAIAYPKSDLFSGIAQAVECYQQGLYNKKVADYRAYRAQMLAHNEQVYLPT